MDSGLESLSTWLAKSTSEHVGQNSSWATSQKNACAPLTSSKYSVLRYKWWIELVVTLSARVKFAPYDEFATRSSWKIFCDGYHQLSFPFLCLLLPSMNPGTAEGWGQADLNILGPWSSLFLLYLKCGYQNSCSKTFCNPDYCWTNQAEHGTNYIRSFLSFCGFKYSHLFILHSTECQGRSGSPRQVHNNILVGLLYWRHHPVHDTSIGMSMNLPGNSVS